jgi:hypothetical protein
VLEEDMGILVKSVLEACRIAAGDPLPTIQAIAITGNFRVWRNGKWVESNPQAPTILWPGEIAIAFNSSLFPSLAFLVTADGPVVIPARVWEDNVEVVLPNGVELALPRPQKQHK